MQFLTGWGEFIVAYVTFFVSHRLPVMGSIKAKLVTMLGAGGFTWVYSAMSVGVLTWFIIAAARAPYVEIWPHVTWINHVTLTLMALATLIFVLALGRPNPLSFGGMNDERFDPANPGLIGWIHHPLLVVLGLWSQAHILPNGSLAHVIMFGNFLLFSVLGSRIINRRKRRLLGAQEWVQLAATSRHFRPNLNGVIRVALAIILYCTLLYLHPLIIGVDPLAF